MPVFNSKHSCSGLHKTAFLFTFEVDDIFNQKTVQWQNLFLLNIEINKIVCFFCLFVFASLCCFLYCRANSSLSWVLSQQAFQAKATKKFKREKYKIKIFLLHKLEPFPKLGWAELSWKTLGAFPSNPCRLHVSWDPHTGRAGQERRTREEEEEEEEIHHLDFLHLLQEWLAWRMHSSWLTERTV